MKVGSVEEVGFSSTILWEHRASNSALGALGGSFEERDVPHGDRGIEMRGIKHFQEVSDQAEAGDVRDALDPTTLKDREGRSIGSQHLPDRLLDPVARCPSPHVGGEEHAGAEGLGHDEAISGPKPRFGEATAGRCRAVDGQAYGQPFSLQGVASDQRGPVRFELNQCAGEELEQGLLERSLQGVGKGCDDLSAVGLGTHRDDVVEGMDRRNSSEEPGVIQERRKGIHGLNQRRVGGQVQDGGVIGRFQANRNGIGLGEAQPGQHSGQHGSTNL